ncbi:DNA-binding response regulator [Anaerocolumna cellulosilytica]|uniref:Stage 0 sporulation protein A homolog n=1 Tax=Anaerocolumna cellulosilytica TaxID=433286 RepID=A0A6S6R9X4_9FIRM|nr:response regulator transcription factor [Anaerocolumna cellulosilytica]MBB5196859.1 DNA-binding NarL/FixJ family response regulator [Anaerocolumna cellulosilytica]BCJ95748.1 DNA-binding response regulator [Anaerocolumna cellulosilytica]
MKVLLVDDDKLVCQSLKIILAADSDIEVIGMGHNGQEGISLYESLNPDVLLMDIRMDVMSGLDAGEILLKKYPEAKILYLTTFLDDDYIIKALNIGAKGYMMKQDFDSIIPALRAVHKGQNVYGNEIITKLPNLLHQSSPITDYSSYGLTEKEYEIICKIADGLSNKEISEILFLSEGTIRNYISLILEKLSLRDRTQIAIFYYKNR